MPLLSHFFNMDFFSTILICMVSFIGMCIARFSMRYMKGDSAYRSFFVKLFLMMISIIIMITSNHLAILWVSWGASTFLLVQLMIHKPQWKAAQNSGMLAGKNYFLSLILMGIDFGLFYQETGTAILNTLIHQKVDSVSMMVALSLLLISIFMQSAVWPFHKWLISSLNSPTPVSAMMHAGLINGGGILLIRFAPLYLQKKGFLMILFIGGLFTALLGTLWKLMQTDVKRMLACSTMGQMGFMIVQCGLGLFPAAVAHLIWHSLFKAYLFLASGRAAQESRFDLDLSPPTIKEFLCALLCGFVGTLPFGLITHESWLSGDSTLVLMMVGMMVFTQVALSIIRGHIVKKAPLALLVTMSVGGLYGLTVQMIVLLMAPMTIMKPQPLSMIHIVGLIILNLSWLSMLFLRHSKTYLPPALWILKGYVAALNSSQPHPDTVTPHRKYYKY